MLLLAGLGNPGVQYANNRHNVGYMAADEIARRHNFSPWSKKFKGLIAEGRLAGEKAILIKPQTYMNLSGQSIGEAMRFYKLQAGDVAVLYDELDLSPGKVRLKTGGGSGGHNGIRSIDQHIGNGFRRVRIGIGHPGAKELVHGYVLGDFAKDDRDWLEKLLEAIADNADMLASGDDSGFMNKTSLAVSGGARQVPARSETSPSQIIQKAKSQSHIRQARQNKPAIAVPESGPMAAMLKKLLGKD